jgi:hypothetical protein
MQNNNDRWLSIDEAAAAIRSRLGISVGAAQATLIEACASGQVRSRELKSQDYIFTIPAGDWVGAYVEFSTGQMFPSGKFQYGQPPTDLHDENETYGTNGIIEISKHDLDCWLNEQEDSEASDAATNPRDQAIAATKPRDQAISKRLEGGNSPPDNISWKQFCDLICDVADGWIDKPNGRYKRGFSPKTIMRLVKRLKH